MSEKEMEKNLNYGDCNNIFCFFNEIFSTTISEIEKKIDKAIKKK